MDVKIHVAYFVYLNPEWQMMVGQSIVEQPNKACAICPRLSCVLVKSFQLSYGACRQYTCPHTKHLKTKTQNISI